MSDKGETVLDQIIARLNEQAAWNAGFLDLALWSEGHRYRDAVNEMPEAAHLDEESRRRVAAKTAVEMVIVAFPEPVRAQLRSIEDNLINKTMRMLGERPKRPTLRLV